MSKTIFQKIAVTAASVLVGVVGMEVKPTQAATAFWDLTFFDDSGTQVGSGEFSYTPDSLLYIPTSMTDEGFYVNNVLESFSATIDGVDWGIDYEGAASRIRWWSTSNPLGTFGAAAPRGEPLPSAGTGWFFGDSFQGLRTLNLGSNVNVLDRGYWQQNLNGSGGEYIHNEGTWTATLRSLDIPDLGFTIYTDRSAWKTAVRALGASFTTETFDNDRPNARYVDPWDGTITQRGDARPEITFDNGIISRAEGSDASFVSFVNEIENGVFRGEINSDSSEDYFGVEFSNAITWTFPTPVIGFGADWFNIGPGEPLGISGSFGGKQEQTVSLYPKLPTARNEFGGLVGNSSGFLGIVSKGTFNQVTLSSAELGAFFANEDFQVDNVSLATVTTPTPIPESGTILALAAFSLTGLATKKKLISSKSQLPS